MNKNGFLVISLDFELIWGVFDVVSLQEKTVYFRNTLDVVPKILSLFDRNDIHCTWATVGMLFNKHWEDWKGNVPPSVPSYKNSKLSAYDYALSRDFILESEFFFAPNLIAKIRDCGGQEIGTHTYSHYYCLEDFQNEDQFEKDLDTAISLAKRSGVELKSLVFPRNQLKASYLKICKAKGILNVRSNPSDWYWADPTSESILVKLARSGDAYLNFGKKSYPLEDLKTSEALPIQQPASRFLRPVETKTFLRKAKIGRIKEEMTLAAKKDEVYHLWWHPHNFGSYPEQSLWDLQDIVGHYKRLRLEYGFQSRNMAGLGDLVINNDQSLL
jgi:peptidoglycan/xylan/chitin deacetylase (PgdA/CDA1 family)